MPGFQIPATGSTVGPQSTLVAAKKGITSPSRGLSQHHFHTQFWTEKCLSCSQSYSLIFFSTSGIKQPQEEAVHNRREIHQQQQSPLFTSKAFIHCLMRFRTIAPHARSLPASMQLCWGKNKGRERQLAEWMREDKYLTQITFDESMHSLELNHISTEADGQIKQWNKVLKGWSESL